MKKQMKNVTKTIWTLRSMLALFCMVAVLYGVSFVCHADTVKGTITGTSVNVRESASTTAEALESLTTNDLVDVIAETTGDDGMKWYKITTESGVTGYVRSDLIKKATVTVDVTQTENKTAYIAGSNANIRQDASTSSGRVANAIGGSQITIIGEATGADGYKWYQIEFIGNGTTMTGFIRSDLVTFQAPTQDPEITEIEGEMGEGEEPEDNSQDAPTSEPVSEEVTSEPANTDIPVEGDSNDLTIMEPASILEEIPEGFEQTQLQLGEDTFTVWGKGQFYIIYASVNGEAPQYYYYDTIHKSYVAYNGLFAVSDVAVPEEKEEFNYKLVAIICIVVIAVLLMVIGVLAYKLANAGYKDDDDDDDDYYEDDDDIEDDEDDYVDLSDDILAEDSFVPEEDVQIAYEDETIQMPVESINAAQTNYYAETEPMQETEYIPEETIQETEYVSMETAQEEVFDSQADDIDVAGVVYEEENGVEYEEEEEEQPQPKKAKFSQRLLDFFTVEVEEDDEEDDDDEVEEAPKKRKKAKKVQESLFDDDDEDDDLNFIDL